MIALLLLANVAQAEKPTPLAKSLIFHASFDDSADADNARGPRRGEGRGPQRGGGGLALSQLPQDGLCHDPSNRQSCRAQGGEGGDGWRRAPRAPRERHGVHRGTRNHQGTLDFWANFG